MREFFTKLSQLQFFKTSTVLLIVLLAVSLTKFYKLNGGIIPGEPDEQMYLELVRNLKESLFPQYPVGVGWYFNLPLYLYTAYLSSLLIMGKLLSLRVVSVIFSLLLTVGIYYYLGSKISRWGAFLGSFLFIITPHTLFYSRVGLIDMMVASLSMISFFMYEKAYRQRSLKLSILSGLLLGLAILTKYSALSFAAIFFVFGIYALIDDLVRRRLKSIWEVCLYPPLINLVVSVLVFLFPALILALHDKFRFKQQFMASIFETTEFWGKGSFNFHPEVFNRIPYWLSWEVLALSLVGLLVLLKDRKNNGLLILTFLAVLFFVIKRNPFSRYFIIVSPFFVIFASFALEALIKRLRSSFYFLPVLIAFLLLLLPKTLISFNAGYHTIVEDSARYLDEINRDNKFVFTTYWPNIFDEPSNGSKYSWLSLSHRDASAYTSTPEPLDSVELLKKYGGFALVENIYTRILYREMDQANVVTSQVRQEAEERIKKDFEEIRIIEESSPNYPFSNKDKNSVRIFR